MSGKNKPKLCFVRGNYAYFTTRPLEEQWGDDWSNHAYESNAGPPYEPCWHNEPQCRNNPTLSRGCRPGTTIPLQVGELCQCSICQRDWNPDGTPKYEVITAEWEGPFETPAERYPGTNVSVEDINTDGIAWLASRDRASELPYVRIPPGTSLEDFIDLIDRGGGTATVLNQLTLADDDVTHPELLWKTTIVIVTDYDPQEQEIDELAREAMAGVAKCIRQVQEPVSFDEVAGQVGEFFDS
jgi:hypothetical protein